MNNKLLTISMVFLSNIASANIDINSSLIQPDNNLFIGIDSGGADGVSSSNILYDLLKEKGLKEENYPTASTVHIKNIVCKNADAQSHINICEAIDVNGGNNFLSFQASHFVSYVNDSTREVVRPILYGNNEYFLIPNLICSRSLLPPEEEDLNEDGYYNKTLAYSCKVTH